MTSRNKSAVRGFETEIEKSREEANWKKAVELAEQLKARSPQHGQWHVLAPSYTFPTSASTISHLHEHEWLLILLSPKVQHDFELFVLLSHLVACAASVCHI